MASRYGLLFATSAYLCWGLFPLYWPLLEPADAAEILSMRILCSLLFVVALIAITGRVRSLAALVAHRRSLWRLTAAAVAISINWGLYIWAVNARHVIETSLGYFITLCSRSCSGCSCSANGSARPSGRR